MTRSIAVLLAASMLASTAFAQEHAHPSNAKVGTVHFLTSCKPQVVPTFDRAVAWLHSFEFSAAIRDFEAVVASDPGCAMAHWGIALSRWSNPMATGNRSASQLRTGSAAVESANRAISPSTTERERGYIAAVGELYKDHATVSQVKRVASYEKAMGELAAKHSDDTEAKIFHAISMVAAASPGDKTYAKQRKAGALLEALWAKQPEHPGLAHYIIHTYDYPALAAEASRAARTYASIAPSAAHALHMPSHIFTRTGQWRESIATNLKSREIALKTGAIAEALHALDYTAYAYLQLRREKEAKGVLDQLPDLERRFDVNAVTGAATGAAGVFALAAIPARYALEREEWKDAAALQPKPSDFPWADAMTYFARALGAARASDAPVAKDAIDSLAAIRDRLAAGDEPYWSEQVAIQHLAAQAWMDLAESRVDSALARMRRAAAREDATEKSAVTPGPLAPSRELLGDMLLKLGKPAEALVEYQRTLEKEPNRYRALAGGIKAANASRNTSVERELRSRLESIS